MTEDRVGPLHEETRFRRGPGFWCVLDAMEMNALTGMVTMGPNGAGTGMAARPRF